MKRIYKVAGHLFSISIEDNSPLWEKMGNYAPFLCTDEGTEGADPLFNVEFSTVREEPFERRPFYIEKDADPSQPRLDVYREALPGSPELDCSISADSPRWVIDMAPVQNMKICARIVADGDFRNIRVTAVDQQGIGLFAVNNAAMLMFAFNTATLGTLEMHASVIEKDGYGYLFLGKSGTGKSTHSGLWLKNVPGSTLLNDDNPIVKVEEDGSVSVYGSPWSGKTPCYNNRSVKAGAFVRLRQWPENIIRRSSQLEAYASLYPSCSGLRQIKAYADGMHSTIEHVIGRVPSYELDCLPDAGAAHLCSSTIIRK